MAKLSVQKKSSEYRSCKKIPKNYVIPPKPRFFQIFRQKSAWKNPNDVVGLSNDTQKFLQPTCDLINLSIPLTNHPTQTYSNSSEAEMPIWTTSAIPKVLPNPVFTKNDIPVVLFAHN